MAKEPLQDEIWIIEFRSKFCETISVSAKVLSYVSEGETHDTNVVRGCGRQLLADRYLQALTNSSAWNINVMVLSLLKRSYGRAGESGWGSTVDTVHCHSKDL